MARLHRRVVRQGQETKPYFTRITGKSRYRYYEPQGSKELKLMIKAIHPLLADGDRSRRELIISLLKWANQLS